VGELTGGEVKTLLALKTVVPLNEALKASLVGGAESLVGEAESLVGEAESLVGEAESLVGEAESLVGEAESLVGEAESLVGEAESLVGAPESLVGAEEDDGGGGLKIPERMLDSPLKGSVDEAADAVADEVGVDDVALLVSMLVDVAPGKLMDCCALCELAP
jgi:hypothetical protein